MDFRSTRAYPELERLSKKPVDLPAALSPERLHKKQESALGFTLFFATERVNHEVMDHLFDMAKELDLVGKMGKMQAGEKLNTGEDRCVLHTAMRDQFDQRILVEPAQEAARAAGKELEKLYHFLESIEGNYTDLIQIGIGGSDLGPRALYIALRYFQKPGRRIHFISNVDPDDAASVLNEVDLKRTLVVVVSKSGTTLETLTNEMFVRKKMEALGLDPKEHLVAVTAQGSPMDSPARYKASFYIWDYVGGRYSATSMVGAVMLGFALGFDALKELLRGAHEMDVHARSEKGAKNLPLVSALLGIWNRNFLHFPTVAVIPYSQALLRFTAHLQQLDMESNGKQAPFSTGPIIWGEPGTNGQHSFYQWIHQGTDIAPVEFIGFRESQRGDDLKIEGTSSQQKLLANLFAQSIALAVGQPSDNPNQIFLGNRPNRVLLAEKLTPHTLGALLAFYEHKVAFQGFAWNINSFDQEGVQLGKKLATKLLTNAEFPLGSAYLKEAGVTIVPSSI
jgi:glucose-6-phosphate isomerase